jgi:hypothetical protein
MRNERTASPLEPRLELGDEAHDLLAASSVPEMAAAARKLRLTALNVRQYATQRPLIDGFEPAPAVEDLERRRIGLANLAVDVVTAVDYLLSLLARPYETAPRLMLAGGASPYPGRDPAGDDVHERLTRQRLDARAAAVRLGMQLVAELRGDVGSTYPS